MNDRPTILDRLSIAAGNLHEIAEADANQDLLAELENLDRIALDMATEMRVADAPTIRQQAAEQIAQAIEGARIERHWNIVALAAAGECASIAREIGAKG